MTRRLRPNRGGSFEKWTVRLLLPALLLALVCIALLVAGVRGPDWRAWFDGPERGNWRAVTIDGLDVFDERMFVTIADGQVQGGRDGCNDWGYTSDADPVTGERMILSTLAGCEETVETIAYRTVAHYRADVALIEPDTLRLRFGEVSGEFTRWTQEMEDAEQAAEQNAIDAARTAQPSERSPVYPASDGVPPPPMRPPPPPAMEPPPAPAD